MARDYTKYTVKGLGENLNKRQLVFQIVKDYVEKNKPSFDELTAVFKDEIQGSKGFIRKAAKVEDPKRFNTKIPLKVKFGVEVVVSNQWGSKNIDAFLSLAKKLKYKISEEVEEEEIIVDNKSLEANTNVLVLSDDLVLKDFDPKWAKYLTLKYQNSADCSDEFSRVKIDLENNHIIPLLESNDDYNKKWFGSWESLLSIDNKENYSSSMLLVFSNDKLDDYGEWRVLWHDIIEGLDDGDYPEGVSDSKLDEIFSGTWFSNIHAFVTKNFNNSSNQNQDSKAKDNKIEKGDTEKSKMNEPSSQDLSVDIELRKDNQELICTIKSFDVNREDSEVKNMYDALLYNFDSGDMTTLITYHLFEDFIREIYHEFLTNSHPSDDEYGTTIEDVQKDNFDWWEYAPHLVVTRIGEIDLNPIANFDVDDENILNKCCEMLDINEEDKDRCEDYVDDYMSDARFSVDQDLFKEVIAEL